MIAEEMLIAEVLRQGAEKCAVAIGSKSAGPGKNVITSFPNGLKKGCRRYSNPKQSVS